LRDAQHNQTAVSWGTLSGKSNGCMAIIPPMQAKMELPMTCFGKVESPLSGAYESKLFVASYDRGYEFSQEHYIALQCMVEDAAEQDATLARAAQQAA
jgi:hypothetical protein